jgi:hypothetical protein
MFTGTLYDVLSVDPDASAEEVRAAFHRLSKKVHPDKGGSDALFCLVSDAYEVLSDPARRAAYDRWLRLPPRPLPRDAGPQGPFAGIRDAPTVSLAFSGAITYANTAPVSSGALKIEPASGPVRAVTGTLTIPGTLGGDATVGVAIARVLGVGVGAITVFDPAAHLDTVAVVLSGSLERAGSGQVSGAAAGLLGLKTYSLRFTV